DAPVEARLDAVGAGAVELVIELGRVRTRDLLAVAQEPQLGRPREPRADGPGVVPEGEAGRRREVVDGYVRAPLAKRVEDLRPVVLEVAVRQLLDQHVRAHLPERAPVAH